MFWGLLTSTLTGPFLKGEIAYGRNERECWMYRTGYTLGSPEDRINHVSGQGALQPGQQGNASAENSEDAGQRGSEHGPE